MSEPKIRDQLTQMVELDQGDSFIWPSKQRAVLWVDLLSFLETTQSFMKRMTEPALQIDALKKENAELRRKYGDLLSTAETWQKLYESLRNRG